MKKILLTIASYMVTNSSYSQNTSDNYLLDFEDVTTLQYLINDTVNAPDNIWRVGAPQKDVFTSAASAPNAVATDLYNSYPTNNTSSFIITYVVSGLHAHEYAGIGGTFMSNTDSLVDFGKLEVSFDHGASWIDLLDDSVIQNDQLHWKGDYGYGTTPSFTGNSNGWQWFDVNAEHLYVLYNQLQGDTSLYRFTFISDGNQTNKDGLMFDNLYTYDWTLLGVWQPAKAFYSNVFPVPSSDNIVINYLCKKDGAISLRIFDPSGKEWLTDASVSRGKISVDISFLPTGIYFYKLLNSVNGDSSFGRFVRE